MRYLSTLVVLFFGLCLTAPAFTQEDAPAEPVVMEDAGDDTDDADVVAVVEAGDTDVVDTENESAVPETDEEAVDTIISIVDALKAGQWALAVGLFLSLLVYITNRFTFNLPAKAEPWVAFGAGVAGATGTGLVMGHPILEAIVTGMLAGVAAIGGWEMVVKYLTPGSGEEPAPTE